MLMRLASSPQGSQKEKECRVCEQRGSEIALDSESFAVNHPGRDGCLEKGRRAKGWDYCFSMRPFARISSCGHRVTGGLVNDNPHREFGIIAEREKRKEQKRWNHNLGYSLLFAPFSLPRSGNPVALLSTNQAPQSPPPHTTEPLAEQGQGCTPTLVSLGTCTSACNPQPQN